MNVTVDMGHGITATQVEVEHDGEGYVTLIVPTPWEQWRAHDADTQRPFIGERRNGTDVVDVLEYGERVYFRLAGGASLLLEPERARELAAALEHASTEAER